MGFNLNSSWGITFYLTASKLNKSYLLYQTLLWYEVFPHHHSVTSLNISKLFNILLTQLASGQAFYWLYLPYLVSTLQDGMSTHIIFLWWATASVFTVTPAWYHLPHGGLSGFLSPFKVWKTFDDFVSHLIKIEKFKSLTISWSRPSCFFQDLLHFHLNPYCGEGLETILHWISQPRVFT